MEKLVVACAQEQMRLFDSRENYFKELNRFLFMARAKGAQLVVFPALAGVMAAAPMLDGFRANLLRQADNRRRRGQSLWSRTRGALANSTAGLVGASFRKAFATLLESDPDALRSEYESVFEELARTYAMTIVAGSAYLPDGSGTIRHQATVFGPRGQILGSHSKIALSAEDRGFATPGDVWTVVTTPVGRLGILIGEEVLYPEAGRVLAYQGADVLITLAAVSDDRVAAYIRQATISRAQENQCFALASFLVGRNHLAPSDSAETILVGKSGIYAPLEMTQRFTGVLVEMGTALSEGLLTAELDRDDLQRLWANSPAPVRRRMPVEIFASYLPSLYGSQRTLEDVWPSIEAEPHLALGAAGATRPDRALGATSDLTENVPAASGGAIDAGSETLPAEEPGLDEPQDRVDEPYDLNEALLSDEWTEEDSSPEDDEVASPEADPWGAAPDDEAARAADEE